MDSFLANARKGWWEGAGWRARTGGRLHSCADSRLKRRAFRIFAILVGLRPNIASTALDLLHLESVLGVHAHTQTFCCVIVDVGMAIGQK